MSRARSFQIKLLPAALAAALVLVGSATVASAQSYDPGSPSDQSASQYEDAQSDPSSRVARLAYLSGDVEFAPAGENDFGSADVNRPLTTGDRLLTGDDGRAALELGGAALRIDHGSAFNFLDLNDTTAQVELSQGTLNLRVRDVGQNQTYEIDTPTVAFVANQPGAYRVDVAPDGTGAMVTVFDGAGTVYGEDGASRAVDAGQSYRFNDSSLANVEVSGLPQQDDFDRWADARDNRWQNSVSRRYVSPEVVGYDDLDDYGAWSDTPDYGQVWYPTQVSAGWAPYRDGHWAWIDPWGWTWVDDAPWGFAPFHYGRWVYVGNRWGWCPGPRQYRPVYAPALVAFVGGSGFSVSISLGGGSPVGWFPLGPRDVYVPWYHASRNYFTNVNVTNIRNVYVNQTVINNYYGSYAANRPLPARYTYRENPQAFTAVPRNVFTSAKPVRNAVLHVPPRALAQAQVMPTPHIAPTKASLAIRPPARPIAAPARAFDRTVIAKHAPPPRPVPFAARERVIAKQGGAPIPVAQLREMRQQQAASKPQPQRVQVVAAKPQAAKPLPPMKHVQNLSPAALNKAPIARAPGRASVQAPEQETRNNAPGQAHISPIRAPVHPSNGAAPSPPTAPLRPGELPSARFAHPERNAPSAPGRNPQQQQLAQQTQAQQQAQAQQRAAQQQTQAQQRAAQQQAQAQQHAIQAQQAQQRAQSDREQAQMRAQQAQQHALQAQQAQQKADQARIQQQQAQQREAQARQHDEQVRAQQEQQRAQMEQQRADQARQQQQEQQREARQQQMRAQQAQQQAEQARQQQEAQQRQAQMMQQRQAQEAQMRAMQAQQAQQQAEQQMRAAQQHQQHAPPPPPQSNQPPPKKKDNDQQDNGH